MVARDEHRRRARVGDVIVAERGVRHGGARTCFHLSKCEDDRGKRFWHPWEVTGAGQSVRIGHIPRMATAKAG